MRLSSMAGALVLAVAATSVVPAQAQGVKTIGSGNLIIKSVNLQGLSLDRATGLVTATGGTVNGFIAGVPFTTDIENFTLQLLPPGSPGAGCSILNLELAPIKVRLLGLHVDTSPICLNITAIPGGGLLGDLLCGIAGGGLPLDLLNGFLTDLLGDLLTPAANPGQGGGGGGGGGGNGDVCTGDCEILDLVLGPIDLTLLGLNVVLDNCDDGPVEVCISATASEGLLGRLLCSLTGPDLLNIRLNDIAKLIKKALK